MHMGVSLSVHMWGNSIFICMYAHEFVCVCVYSCVKRKAKQVREVGIF